MEWQCSVASERTRTRTHTHTSAKRNRKRKRAEKSTMRTVKWRKRTNKKMLCNLHGNKLSGVRTEAKRLCWNGCDGGEENLFAYNRDGKSIQLYIKFYIADNDMILHFTTILPGQIHFVIFLLSDDIPKKLSKQYYVALPALCCWRTKMLNQTWHTRCPQT